MAITTSGVLPPAVRQTLSMTLLSVPTPNFIYKIPAEKKRMPRNGGDTMRFRRYSPLNASPVPLGNSGVTPPSQNFTSLDIDARIDWYGSWVEVNEQVVLANQESVLNEAAIRLGVSLRQTEDQLVRDMLSATAAQLNCVNGTNGDVPTELTAEDISVAVRTLLSADGHMFLSGIQGEDRFGSAPVRMAYFALCNTDLTSDLENVDGFIPQANYPNQVNVIDSEWGSVRNLRFLVSSVGANEANASANANSVYNVSCVAKESYACVEQDGATAQFIYRPPVYSGPLAQNVTLGYKFAQVPRILNDAWVLNLRCTLTA